MKNNFLYLMVLLLIACSSTKRTEEALNTGNYDQAIAIALKNLKTNKHKKSKQPFILMLEEAFKKAKARDEDHLAFILKSNNAAQLEEAYQTLQTLKDRQERIKPILPLKIIDKNKYAKFSFANYDQQIIQVKEELTAYLYKNATELMNSTSKFGFRQAYNEFTYLDKVNPNYKDTRKLMEEAHKKGTDFVWVEIKNETQQVIPKRLEEDLLNFGTYGLNDLWTVYHNNVQKSLPYDFKMDIELRTIDISPEQTKERVIIKEKQIPDGKKDLLDEDGNVVKDSLGNPIKIDKFKTIRCDVTEFYQYKSTLVKGQVSYTDLITQQLIDSFPLESEFEFEHYYATYNGDRNALDTRYIDLIQQRAVPFPSNEQMIYDSGEELKNKIKQIITQQVFR